MNQCDHSECGGFLCTYKLANVERAAIVRALGKTEGNKRACAKLLGIGKTTLYRKMDLYRISYAQ